MDRSCLSAVVFVLAASCGVLTIDVSGNIKRFLEEAVKEAIDHEVNHCENITSQLGCAEFKRTGSNLNSVFNNEKCEDLCPWCWLCFPQQDVEQCENYCESECDYKYIEVNEGPKNKRSQLDVCIDGDSNVDVKLAPLEDSVSNIVDGLIGGNLGKITDSLEDGVKNTVDGLVGGSLGEISDSLADVGNILDVDKLVGDLAGSTGELLGGLDKILDVSSSVIPEGLVDELLDKATAPVVGALSSIAEDILKPPSAGSVLEPLTGGAPATSSLLDKVADEVAAALLDRVGDNTASGIFSNVLPTDQNNALDSKAKDETLLDVWASKLADGALDEGRVTSSDVLQDAVKAAVVDKLTSDSLVTSDSNDILKQTLTSAISKDIASKILG